MTDVKIDFESEIFRIDVTKEKNYFIIEADTEIPFWMLKNTAEDIKDKKFNVLEKTDNETNKWKQIRKNISFQNIVDENGFFITREEIWYPRRIEVVSPGNIIQISIKNTARITAKNPEPVVEDAKKSFIRSFDFAKNYKNYNKFIKFFKGALDKNHKIIENEEFPGKMLKFFENDKLIKCVYIRNEEFRFAKSFANEYRKMKLRVIKENIEDLNEQLNLEGKEKLKLELKND